MLSLHILFYSDLASLIQTYPSRFNTYPLQISCKDILLIILNNLSLLILTYPWFQYLSIKDILSRYPEQIQDILFCKDILISYRISIKDILPCLSAFFAGVECHHQQTQESLQAPRSLVSRADKILTRRNTRLRQVLLLRHRSPAGLPRPLGCCHGPEAWRSSTRPVWRPGTRTSASGDCFWRRCTTRKTCKIDLKVE